MSIAPTPVVYVAGSGHSGSTLLALLLDAHPEIACVGETAVKPGIRWRGDTAAAACSCGATIGECPFWRHVFALVRQQGHDLGPDRWTNDYRFEHPLPRRLLNRACASAPGRHFVTWAATHLPLYRRRVAGIDGVNVAFIRAILQVAGARVFADTSKPVARLLHLQRIPGLDVKMVLLVRDVRGYAASAKRRGLSPFDAARTWKRDQVTISEMARRGDGERFHRVRYEDVCSDPGSTLRDLWRFCGVTAVDPPDVLDAASHHILGNSMRMGGEIRIRLDQSWKNRLDAGEARQVLAIAGDVNRALGYD
jgi:hypothetical protein